MKEAEAYKEDAEEYKEEAYEEDGGTRRRRRTWRMEI